MNFLGKFVCCLLINSVGEVGFTSRQEVIQGFLELMKDIKEVELHLTMGESIVHAVLGPLSPEIGRASCRERG